MTQRSFDDAYWNDPFVQELEKDAKMLFLYLWTNKQCNSAGLYEITLKTISFDTGIDQKDLLQHFKTLEPKVAYFSDSHIAWVKNFVKRQPKSPQYLMAVAKCLSNFNNNGLISEYLKYNGSLGVSIPYQYPINTPSVAYPYALDKDKDIDKDIDNIKGGLGGKEKTGLIFKIFDDNFQRITEANREVLGDYIDNYGADEVLVALNKAVKQNKRSLAYVEGILKGAGHGKGSRGNQKSGGKSIPKPGDYPEPEDM